MSFQPQRISRTAKITVNAPLDEAFALFGPIREKDWADGWDPQLIDPVSELVQERMVFTTQTHFGQEEPDDVWIISAYSVGDSFIEYTVFEHERVRWIEVVCEPTGSDETTRAEITYTYLGLTDRGNSLSKESLDLIFEHDLRDWEEAINHYLAIGERKHLH
ncbi:MAG: hypothetical protein ABSC51_10455 [Gaiellaceae bacterium]|jgi:hypothetical protein